MCVCQQLWCYINCSEAFCHNNDETFPAADLFFFITLMILPCIYCRSNLFAIRLFVLPVLFHLSNSVGAKSSKSAIQSYYQVNLCQRLH